VQLVFVFALAFALFHVLGLVPGLDLVTRVPLLGFLACVLVVSALWNTVGRRVQAARTLARTLASLERVDTPAMHGKRGAALLAAGRPRAALEPLARARAGEPREREWLWRHASALAAVGRDAEAVREVQELLGLDETYAYGRARLLAARLAARLGQREAAVAHCQRFERDHGEEPEALYELGSVLAASGERAAARQAFERAARLAHSAARFKRRGAPWLLAKARLRAFVGR
jgi:tetratricopeptide (TPR) repeat protein